jgi:protein gp37/ParB-like chromosome segregation protein Spo0J
MMRHPLCRLFPPMREADYTALKASLAARGYDPTKPVVLYEGQILDGWHRWKAARKFGLTATTREYHGADPLGQVLADNLDRRHLDEGGRALVAARLAKLRQGQTKTDRPIGLSETEAAGRFNIGTTTVKRARRVLDAGTPELVAAVEQGMLAVSLAADLAELPASQQRRVLTEPDRNARKALSKRLAAQGRAMRQARPTRRPQFALTTQASISAKGTYSVEAWQQLNASQRGEIIAAGFESKQAGSMNEQTGDSIEWARWSHNTVTGCLHDCPYCYARDIAERVYKPYGFAPTFHPARLSGPAQIRIAVKKVADDPAHANIFANSMSDLFGAWVPRDWIEATIEMARRNPAWHFLTLTKFPQRAVDFEFPENWWMGTTVDAQARVANAERAFEKIRCQTKWLSVEPLLGPLTFTRLDLFQWLVIGGASASTKTPAWQPSLHWIAPLHVAAREAGVRIYYKTNCGLSDALRVREFPWTKPRDPVLPKALRYLRGL